MQMGNIVKYLAHAKCFGVATERLTPERLTTEQLTSERLMSEHVLPRPFGQSDDG